YYVTDDYKYASVVVTKDGDDYSYVEGGATKKLTRRSNGAGAYQYFLTVGGKERTALIDYKLENRNGFLKYFITKCSGQEGQAHLWSPPISRLAEIHLIRAEAYAKLGQVGKALEEVNLIRKRAGIPDAGLWTTTNLGEKSALDVVMAERK